MRYMVLMFLVGVLSCAASRAGDAPPGETNQIPLATGGKLRITVTGVVAKVVLIDPLGRRDEENPKVPHQGIPKCLRVAGVQESDESADVPAPEAMMFSLPENIAGKYVLLGTVEPAGFMVVSATKSCASGEARSGYWEGKVRGPCTWEIMLWTQPGGDSCSVKVTRRIQAKKKPRG